MSTPTKPTCDASYFESVSKCILEPRHDGAHAGITKASGGACMLITWDQIVVPNGE